MLVYKHKWLIIVAITVGILAAIAVAVYKSRLSTFEDVKLLIDDAYIVVEGRTTAINDSNIINADTAPFIKNGEMYASLNDVASHLNATFSLDSVSNVVTVESNGCITQFMTEFNVLIFNDEPIFMRSKPAVQGEHIFLPVNVISKILNVSCFRDYNNAIAVFHAKRPLEDDDYRTILKKMNIEYSNPKVNDELEKLKGDFPDDDIYMLSRSGRLFVSDTKGALAQWLLLDNFELDKKIFTVAHEFTPSTVYYSGEKANKLNLFILGTNKEYSLVPDEIIKKDMIFAMYRYSLLKISNDSDLQIWSEAISGSYSEVFYMEKKIAVINGEYELATSLRPNVNPDFENQWKSIFAHARIGDTLLFRNSSSDSTHGFYNHSALIIDKLTDTGELRVLQSRSHEEGVGADLPIDFISFESLNSENYWLKYDIISLARPYDLSEENAAVMAKETYENYNGYEFGYGGYYGAKQATCAEIPKNAYESQKIKLIDDSQLQHLVKSVVEGDAKALLFLPDDIALSSNISLLGIAER